MDEDGTVPPLLRIAASGHPSIRATHDATWELSADEAITGRATCVVGVGARVLAGSTRSLAGPVTLTLRTVGPARAGGAAGSGDDDEVRLPARANPWFAPGDGWVVRRSGERRPDTVATDCPLGAGDLPRGLVVALRRPDRTVELDIDRADRGADGIPTVAMVRVPPAGPWPADVWAWLHSGHPRVIVDAAAATAVARAEGAPPAPEPHAGAGVIVVVAGVELPSLPPDLRGGEVRWEMAGLTSQEAVVAAVGFGGPVVVADRGRHAFDAARRRAGSSATAVGTLVPEVARRVVADLAPDVAVGAVLGWSTWAPRVVTGDAAAMARALAATRHDVVLAVAPGPGPGPSSSGSGTVGSDSVDPDIAADHAPAADRDADALDLGPIDVGVLRDLLDAGVSARTLVDVVARRPGVSRNAAQRAVAAARRDRSRSDDPGAP